MLLCVSEFHWVYPKLRDYAQRELGCWHSVFTVQSPQERVTGQILLAVYLGRAMQGELLGEGTELPPRTPTTAQRPKRKSQ